MRTSRQRRNRLRPAALPRAGREPGCLIWLRHPEHVCQAGGDRVAGSEGEGCEVWARVRAARRFEASAVGSHDRYQAGAEDAAVALLSATLDLLELAKGWAGLDRGLADASSAAADALLRLDRLATLAGWGQAPTGRL